MMQAIPNSIYIDRFEVNFNDYTFKMATGSADDNQFILELKFSPELAKQMYLIIRKATRDFEDTVGAIRITPETLHHLGIPEEDWDA